MPLAKMDTPGIFRKVDRCLTEFLPETLTFRVFAPLISPTESRAGPHRG
jgi:hypothetical protein